MATTPPSKKDRKRRIRFDKSIQIIEIEPRSTYTSIERCSTWYTNKECKSFKVQYVRESLESGTSDSAMDFARSERIDAVRDLLLQAQDIQRKVATSKTKTTSSSSKGFYNGNSNDSFGKKGSYSRWLADFYKHHSEACGAAARSRGLANCLSSDSSKANQRWSVRDLTNAALTVTTCKTVPQSILSNTVHTSTPSKAFNVSSDAPKCPQRKVPLTPVCKRQSLGRTRSNDLYLHKHKKALALPPCLDDEQLSSPRSTISRTLWSTTSPSDDDLKIKRWSAHSAHSAHSARGPLSSRLSPLTSRIRRGSSDETNDNSSSSFHGDDCDTKALPRDLPLKPLRHITTPPLLHVA